MRFILNLVYFSAKLCQNTLSDLGIKGGFTQLGLHSHGFNSKYPKPNIKPPYINPHTIGYGVKKVIEVLGE
jgi:hypothetical protein